MQGMELVYGSEYTRIYGQKTSMGGPRGKDRDTALAATGCAPVFNIQTDRCPTLVAVHHDPSRITSNPAASAQLRLCEGTTSTKDNNTTKNQGQDVYQKPPFMIGWWCRSYTISYHGLTGSGGIVHNKALFDHILAL
jgi:hypothetical protein